ncbi:hypothetical protein BC832DRAFT_556063 [Gaertneriomyces semiglobifer]|nr:hypothetical protein BC832DRAFT_556063 [Gaertneriomyces semiglobifer]
MDILKQDLSFLWPTVRREASQAIGHPVIGLVHSLWIAYSLKKANLGPNGPFRGLLAHLLVSLGGSTLACLITQRTPPILLSNFYIPIYTLGYVLINTPLVFSILSIFSFITEPVLMTVDAFTRAWTLSALVDSFISASPVHKEAQLGQILIGTIGITGGGVLYSYFSNNMAKMGSYPGWNFTVGASVATLYVICKDSYLGSIASDYWKHTPVRPHVLGLTKAIGMPKLLKDDDVRLLCALLLAGGFMLGWLFSGSNQSIGSKKNVVMIKPKITDVKINGKSVPANPGTTVGTPGKATRTK